MRVALIGTSALSLSTARILLRRGHEVVIIESQKTKIDALAEEMDCGFVHGDGTRPAVLREVGPSSTDVFFALTDTDQDNIIAALVARSLGYERVVPKIRDPEYQHVCTELGLTDSIIPDTTIARTLADSVEGRDIVELSTLLRGELRFFSFAVGEEELGPIGEIQLPDRTRPVCVYRGEDFLLPEPDTALKKGDEVLLVTHASQLETLRERWAARDR